ncbi:MAG: hypothetical protein ACFE9D_02685 [Promethearchaeota archaeon]
MHFTTKILKGMVDESVHRAFLRYGRGEYPGPAAEITKTKAGNIKVRTTYMYQDLPASMLLTLVPVETISVSGILLGYEPLDEVLAGMGFESEPSKKKPRTLLYQSKLVGEYSRKQVEALYNEVGPNAYVFCNLKTSLGWSHKVKAKIPSAQKEPRLEERLKFGTTQIPAKTEFEQKFLSELVPDFIEEIPLDFSSLLIENNYEIQKLLFPPEMKKISSKELRLKTQRSGILHRALVVDGSKFTREHSMTV